MQWRHACLMTGWCLAFIVTLCRIVALLGNVKSKITYIDSFEGNAAATIGKCG